MNISYITDVEIGSQGFFITQALNKYTSNKARCITICDNYIEHLKDLWLGMYIERDGKITMKISADEHQYRLAQAKEIIQNSDFFIFRRTRLYTNWIKELTPYNHVIVLYGSEARLNPALYYWLSEKEHIMLVSSSDYSYSSLIGFSCQHMPISIDMDIVPRKKLTSEKVRVVHAPTDRDKKLSDVFEKVSRKLNCESVVIENKTWKESLAIKATCDISFDQIWLGHYGMASVESMAMEQPSLCYLNGWTLSMYPSVPIVNVKDEQTLETTLMSLIRDDKKRNMLGWAGKEFVAKYHDIKQTAKRWDNLIHFVKEERP